MGLMNTYRQTFSTAEHFCWITLTLIGTYGSTLNIVDIYYKLSEVFLYVSLAIAVGRF